MAMENFPAATLTIRIVLGLLWKLRKNALHKCKLPYKEMLNNKLKLTLRVLPSQLEAYLVEHFAASSKTACQKILQSLQSRIFTEQN
jgi:hypothetical protein